MRPVDTLVAETRWPDITVRTWRRQQEGRDDLYQTENVGGPFDQIKWGYSSLERAEKGHAKMVEITQAVLWEEPRGEREREQGSDHQGVQR